jgi:hypothetical protein
MHDTTHGLLATLGAVGAGIGIGHLLVSDEKITWRRALGRAIVTAGLAVGSASILIWIPGLPVLAIVGAGCAVASLGTTGLERILQRYFLRK